MSERNYTAPVFNPSDPDEALRAMAVADTEDLADLADDDGNMNVDAVIAQKAEDLHNDYGVFNSTQQQRNYYQSQLFDHYETTVDNFNDNIANPAFNQGMAEAKKAYAAHAFEVERHIHDMLDYSEWANAEGGESALSFAKMVASPQYDAYLKYHRMKWEDDRLE